MRPRYLCLAGYWTDLFGSCMHVCISGCPKNKKSGVCDCDWDPICIAEHYIIYIHPHLGLGIKVLFCLST